MKRYFVCVMMLVLLSVFLVSCSVPGDQELQETRDVQDTQEKRIVLGEDNELMSASPDGKLRLITISSGIIRQFTASTSTGVYRLRGYADATASILEYDSETMELNYLMSDKPIVEDILGGGVVADTDDSLLVFKMGHVPFEGYEGAPSRIYRYSFEGELLGTVELPENCLFRLDSSVAYDGRDIYMVLEEYDLLNEEEGPVLSGTNLSKVDIYEGEIEKITELGMDKSNAITGTSNDGIVLMTTEQIKITAENMYASPETITARSYSLEKGEFSAHEISWANGSRSGMFDAAGRLLYFEDGGSSLKSYDINTGKEDILIDDVNITGDSSYGVYITDDIYDNHLMCVLDNGKDSVYIGIDLNTNKVIELNLQYQDEDDGEYYTVQVVDEIEDYFVVMTGIQYIPTVQYGGGNEYRFDESVEELKLIRKSDYWKSVASYLEFKDNVYQ